jgi:hypothetical protein
MNGCVPRGWSAENFRTAYLMWCEGRRAVDIGRAIGVSRFAVCGVKHRYGWPSHKQAPAKPKPETRSCLPAGHPDTWGLISNDRYPGL